MKVLDCEKTIAFLQQIRKLLPGRNGVLPHKFLSREGMDCAIQNLEKKAIEVTVTPDTGSVKSHSETEIVKGCISLMQELTGQFEDYLDFMNIVPENDEERFAVSFTYSEIVNRLLLWKTTHSGGTSTMEKCQELGFDSSETVRFEDERDKEGEDDD